MVNSININIQIQNENVEDCYFQISPNSCGIKFYLEKEGKACTVKHELETWKSILLQFNGETKKNIFLKIEFQIIL